MQTKGIPIIIAAPSGAGKTSLVAKLVETMPQLVVSISHTTRPMRPGEQNGLNYHFVDHAQFTAMIAAHDFIEHAQVFGHYYGTSKAWLAQQIKQGFDVLLEIDWQGAQQIRALFPGAISIFILPPSYAVLQQRLLQRAQDNPTVIQKRMQQAKHEIAHYREFDYLVVNDQFEQACQNLQAIIRSQRLTQAYQGQQHRELLEKLLA